MDAKTRRHRARHGLETLKLAMPGWSSGAQLQSGEMCGLVQARCFCPA
jgi:hypothetical protein